MSKDYFRKPEAGALIKGGAPLHISHTFEARKSECLAMSLL